MFPYLWHITQFLLFLLILTDIGKQTAKYSTPDNNILFKIAGASAKYLSTNNIHTNGFQGEEAQRGCRVKASKPGRTYNIPILVRLRDV